MNKEDFILDRLRERVKGVTGGKVATPSKVRGIIRLCSSWSFFGVTFKDEDPEQLAIWMKILIAKGLVKVFEDIRNPNEPGLPSFVPSDCLKTDFNGHVRDFTQNDAI